MHSLDRSPPPGKTAQADTANEPGTSRMKRCYVHFNVAGLWYMGTGTPDSTQNNLFSVTLHEFGHCVGLARASTPTAVMRESLLPGQTLRNLAPGDIAGRNKVDGAP